MLRLARATAPLLVGLAGVTGSAHEHAAGTTAERMQMMKAMATHVEALGEMLAGRKPYDGVAVQRHALALHETCHGVADKFPDAAHDHNSRADPAVWEKPEEFRTQMDNLQSVVGELVTASTSGQLEEVRSSFVALGRACTTCHETFRLPDN